MTAAEIKDILITAIAVFALWRTMKIEVRLSKEIMDLEHRIDLLNVHKADKQ